MNATSWSSLQVGDLVRHKTHSDAYLVTDINKARASVTIVRVREIHKRPEAVNE